MAKINHPFPYIRARQYDRVTCSRPTWVKATATQKDLTYKPKETKTTLPLAPYNKLIKDLWEDLPFQVPS